MATTPTEARELKALLARRQALAQDLRRERNRRGKALATDTPARILHSSEDTMAFLDQALAKLQRDINDHIDRHPRLKDDLALLTRIPAVGPHVGSHLLAILHSHAFYSAEQLAAYLGLVPVERQSGTSVLGRANLSKAGPAPMRVILYMAAIVATRYPPCPIALSATVGAGQDQNGSARRRHAQTHPSLLRRPQNPNPLSSRLRIFRLTGKTVSTSLVDGNAGSRKLPRDSLKN